MTILVEETIKEFGYNPNELSHGSNKKILVACDDCGKVRKIRNNAYHSLCLSCKEKGKRNHMFGRTGEKHPLFGKHHSEETKIKMKNAHPDVSGANNPMFGGHHSKETKRILSEKHKNPSESTRIKMREHHADVTGKNNPFYGKTHTKEAMERIVAGNRGKKVSEETKKKISLATKGENHPNYGKHYPTKWRENISKGLKCHYKAHPETRDIIREKREKQQIPSHHTKPELIFLAICEDNNIPFHFVGDSQLWIGKGRRKLNPDFCELNGKKIVIEIFGDYWHSPLINKKIGECQTLEYRKNHYKKYGWKSIFIWESDLVREDAEQFVLNLLKKEEVFKV